MHSNPLLVRILLMATVARNVVGVSGFQIFCPAVEVLRSKRKEVFRERLPGKSSRLLSSSERNGEDGIHSLVSLATKTEHTVTWITLEDSIEFTAADGETLRTAALRSGAVSPHNRRANLINCRGLGTCGTCAVSIHFSDCDGMPPPIEPSGRNTIEKWRLSLPPGHGLSSIDSDLRLACQVRVKGNMKVTKYAGFWGQNIGHLAEKSLPTKPLGELEFILDNKNSPTNY